MNPLNFDIMIDYSHVEVRFVHKILQICFLAAGEA
jgi:hypothetical protein